MKKSLVLTQLALSAVTACPAFAQADTPDTDATVFQHDSTINALDHVLQRPNPARRFDQKRFGDHLWLSASGGIDITRRSHSYSGSNDHLGYRFGISVGDWITPAHGWRINLEGGSHYGVYDSQPYFIALSADYMMNLSALLRGDNNRRTFELMALAGLELQGVHRCGHGNKMAFGTHFGFQPRLYVSPSTFLFVEPRLGVYSDNIDFVTTWHRYDWNASISLGIGYRMDRLKGFHRDNSLFVNKTFRDNIIFGFSGGMFMTGSNTDNFSHRLGSDLNLFIGKWFNPSSGLRLSVGGGDMKRPGDKRRWIATADLDYMWNINSALNGYDPDRKIETNILLGVSGMITTRSNHHINPALHAAIQGQWNINRNLGLYLEPTIRAFANRLPGYASDRSNIMTGLNLGLVYRTGGASAPERKESFVKEDFLYARRYFIEAKGGVFMREHRWNPNTTISLSMGKWFSPGNGWRATGEYNYEGTRTNYRSFTLGLDYLGSLSTLTTGYDPDRVFDLSVVLGLEAGAAHYRSKYNEFVWGPHAGLRAAFRVSPAIDILLEPSLKYLHIPHMSRRFTPQAQIMAGVSFKPSGRKRDSRNGGDAILVAEDFNRNFVSLTGGPSLFSETLMAKNMDRPSWYADITAGHWFSTVSGLQAGLSYDFIDRKGRESELNVGTIHADYLLNFTALSTGQVTTPFSVIGVIGTGLAWSNHNDGHISPELNLALQLRYRITPTLSVMLAPSMAFWRPALNHGYGNNHKFIGVGRIPVGLSYSF